MHLPERALGGRSLGGFCGHLGVRVDVGQRQVPPHVADIDEVAEQFADDRLRLPAVRALEVAVLDDGHRCLERAADMVTFRVDVAVEVDERLRRAEQRADPCRRGSSAVARNRSQVMIAAPTAALRTPNFASSRWRPSNASVATSSATVKPIPAIVPPPATAAQPTGGCMRPRLSRVTSQEPPTIPTGLPTT